MLEDFNLPETDHHVNPRLLLGVLSALSDPPLSKVSSAYTQTITQTAHVIPCLRNQLALWKGLTGGVPLTLSTSALIAWQQHTTAWEMHSSHCSVQTLQSVCTCGSQRPMVEEVQRGKWPRKVSECYIWYGKLPYLWDRTGSWWILVVGKDEEGECAKLRVLQGQMELRSASFHLLFGNSTVKNKYYSLRALVVAAPVFLDIVCPYNKKKTQTE